MAVDFSLDSDSTRLLIRDVISGLCRSCHGESVQRGWYDVLNSSEGCIDSQVFKDFFVGTQIALIHSEVSELLDAYRKGMDSDLGVELADVVLRCFDLAGALDLDLADALLYKVDLNRTRGVRHGGRKF